ncbi:MAG: nucleotidyl transferase AbiEii/AbiGii toxin family protein [Phycisphaerales bacterium]
MNLSRERLLAESASLSFRPEILEKVARLLSLLEAIRKHPNLKERVALKGGTALNLFLFDVPRLSVDIDLNYIGSADRGAMLAERPEVERAIEVVSQAEGLAITRAPADHAGGKWRMRYQSVLGGNGNIEVDLNFMFRIPLWPAGPMDSRPLGHFSAQRVPVLDIHEIAAGKFAALFARHASRDLFDAHALLGRSDLDDTRLRSGFVAIGAMNRKDWRTVTLDDIAFEPQELQDQLVPVLRNQTREQAGDFEDWARRLVSECQQGLERLLPFRDNEREFLDRLLDHGEARPELITEDPDLAERIAGHPLIAWKARNVRQHRGEKP